MGKIIKNITLIFTVTGIVFLQTDCPENNDYEMVLDILPTLAMTLDNLQNPNIELWHLTVHNFTDTIQTVRIEFEFIASNYLDVLGGKTIWGVTGDIDIIGNSLQNFDNGDFTDGVGLLRFYAIDDNFEDDIGAGYLPGGDYTLHMRLWINLTDDEIENYQVSDDLDDAECVGDVQEVMSVTNLSELVLIQPSDNYGISSQNELFFSWEDPGGMAISIIYNFILAKFDPELGGVEDALDNIDARVLDCTIASGPGESLQFQYQNLTNNSECIFYEVNDLECGYEYVWQVSAAEDIPDTYWYSGSLWQAESPPSSFYFGVEPENLEVSPYNGEEVTTVIPTFNWASDWCLDAYEFEIWLSDEEDSEVEIGQWRLEEILAPPIQFPTDMPGLMPGIPYYWKLRASSGTVPSPWSNIFTFTIQSLEVIEPITGQVLTTVNPSFNVDAPLDITAYELLIGDEENTDVIASVAVFNQVIPPTLPFQYPQQDVLNGLYPGSLYYWKLIVRDASEVAVGSEDEFDVLGSFSISTINLVQPTSGEVDAPLNPAFGWEGPLGVPSYEFWLSDQEDSEVNNPIFIIDVAGSYYQYPTDGDFPLEYSKIYNWKIVPRDVNETPGKPSLVYSFTVMDYPLEPAPDLTATLTGIRDVQFSFSTVSGAEVYHLIISQSTEVDEHNIMSEPIWENADLTSTSYTLTTDEYELEYETEYYVQVVAKKEDIQHSFPSEIISFQTLPEAGATDQAQISLSVSTTDVRIPVINLVSTVEGATDYTIFIYEDAEGSAVILELAAVTAFPYEYSDAVNTFQYETTYYIQVFPFADGEPHGLPSDIAAFAVGEQPGASDSPEISAEVSETGALEIIVNILAGLEQATEYQITLASDESMSDIITQITIPANDVSYTFTDEFIEWGQSYYIQVVSLIDGNVFGQPSDIRLVNVPGKPGSDEQVGISATLPSGSINPQIEIINTITGATGYLIAVSTESDMSAVIFEFELETGTTITYPSDAPQLEYGNTYYFTAQGLDEGNPHGIPSAAAAIFIPNITPPVLGDPFNWDASVPAAEQYFLQISLVEDFSVIIFEINVQGTTHPFTMDNLEYSTGYYWRIQGLDSNDSPFGNPSAVAFFQTEDVAEPTLNPLADEVSLLPEFTWNGIDQAAAYLIEVASEGGMETIIWSNVTSSLSASYPESASLLEFATTYFWRISALNEDEEILSLSVVESFSTQSVFPVIGLSPNGGVETMTPTLQWEANEGFTSYLVEIAEDSEFNTIIFSATVEGNQAAVEGGILQPGKSYFWRVDGLDEGGESSAGPSESATLVLPSTGEIPLISPSPDTQVGNLNPTLKWGSLVGTSTYTLRVAADAGFESIHILEMASGTEFTVPEDKTLANSTTYFWQVEAAIEEDVITSSIGIFTTPSEVAITILGIDDGASISTSNPVFSWEAVEGVAAYGIQFAGEADFSESWGFQTGAASFEYPGDPPFEFDKSYFWQISALNNEGGQIGAWTPPRSFIITAAFIVTLELPASGEAVTTSNPTFQWTAVEGVSKYEIQVSANEDFSEILWSSAEIVENSTSYPGSGAETLGFGSTYHWHVRAMVEDAPLGDFSSTFTFELSGSNTVELEGPLGVESESLLPYFSWLAINSADHYTFTLAADEGMSQMIYTGDAADVFLQYAQDAPPLDWGATYYWNVIAKDSGDASIGDASAVGTFTTPSGEIELEFILEDDG